MVKVAVFVFDLMDTLIDDPFLRTVRHSIKSADLRRFIDAKDNDAFLNFESGFISETEFFRRFFLPNSEIDDLPTPQRLKQKMLQQVEWLPGVAELLSQLTGPKILASNYSVWYQDIFRQRTDIEPHFDYLFFSCEVGHRKPDRLFFEPIHQLIQAEFSNESIIFFDDRQENLAEPTKLGWHTVHINKHQAASMMANSLHQLGLITIDANYD